MEEDTRKILIVDDHIINRKIICNILKDKYEVCEASNGAEAIEMLHQDDGISAILLDIVMPVLDGYAVLDYLAQEHNNDIPVIVMTGENDVQQELKALHNGAWDFVAKPIEPQILLTRLENAIARSENALMRQIRYEAEHDKLTGLYNRGKFYAETRKLIDEHRDTTFVFIKFDIDRFNVFNSDYGEEAGDELIKYLAELIEKRANVYEYCTYGHMEADVFCICQPYDAEELKAEVEETKELLAKYRPDCLLTPSFGAYVIEGPEITIQKMYMRASIAAGICKHQFAVCLSMYSAEQGKKSREETEIVNEMQKALKEEQFVVYFQPKFRLSDDCEYGAEALVRWKHPEKGLIPPGKFIPIFERNGFIAKLDFYVWERTCQILRQWIDKGHTVFPVSVNVSRICMYNPELVDILKRLLEQYQLPVSMLNLEITESAYMTSPELMQKSINQLREAGFIIMMDDFGCGYSSLNTLKDIEVDVLKIDMKFLPMDKSQKKAEIILASIIRMSRWLGLTVVVEGVETQEQKDFLVGVGCDYVQGYFYAKPMPSEAYGQEYVALHGMNKRRRESVPQDERGTILIVDDDRICREILKDCFENKYDTFCCASAEEAMAFLTENAQRTKLIILDNLLPGLSGMDFLEYYRNDTVVSQIPKMMTTVSDTTEAQIEAFRLGVQEFIQKPLDENIIKVRTKNILEVYDRMNTFIEQEEKYKNLVIRDKATNLLNKASFIEKCDEVLAAASVNSYAMVILDIDDFKHINDSFGHLAGDEVIRKIAEELTNTFRKQDITGRFGGDEFVTLLTDIPTSDVVKNKANYLLKSIVYHCARDLHMTVSVSMGVSFGEKGDNFEKLFYRADHALYDSKLNGKGNVTEYGMVPPVTDDSKSVVLVCGKNPQLHQEIALAYGDTVAFAEASCYEELMNAFEQFGERICTICLDIRDHEAEDFDAFYQLILERGGGTMIPLLAACEEGNLEQMRYALTLKIRDLIAVPVRSESIRQAISRYVALYESNREKAGILDEERRKE